MQANRIAGCGFNPDCLERPGVPSGIKDDPSLLDVLDGVHSSFAGLSKTLARPKPRCLLLGGDIFLLPSEDWCSTRPLAYLSLTFAFVHFANDPTHKPSSKACHPRVGQRRSS